MRVHDSDVSVPTVPSVAIPDAEYDAAWVAEAYDSFADVLYAYCRSLVCEPAAAADAVRDTFVVTAFRLAELPDESLLRAWLHAVARNECLRAISGRTAAPALEFLPNDSATDPAGPGAEGTIGNPPAAPDETSPDLMAADPADAQARALLRAALGGLDPAERDFMVMTWHGLAVAECAAVLGISHDEASKVLFRGRDQLEVSAGVLAVIRSDWRECAQLNAMLAGWDGQLTPALRSKFRQHIDRCDICGDQRRAGMSPAVLLRLAPDALRGMGAGALRLTAWVTARLRDQVLAAAFDQELESFEHRAMVVKQAGPFRPDGFPVPLDPPGAAARRKRRSPMPFVLASVGGTGLLIVAAYVALALSGNHSTGALSSWTGLSDPVTRTSAVTASNASASGIGTKPSASPSASPTPTAHATPTTRPSATKPATSSSTAPVAPKTSAPPAAPSINVSPASLVYQPQSGNWATFSSALTLINPTSSPMNWSVSLPSNLRVWGPTSGTLAPNSSDRLELMLAGYGHPGNGNGNGQTQTETLTLQPGNVHVTITIQAQGH
jgi:RNA polymerase sigma factor (sigma-70 family)